MNEQKKEKPLTVKQAGFVKDFIETGNGIQSAINNYNTNGPNSAHQIAHDNLQKPTVQKAIVKAMHAAGISESMLAKKIKEGLNAHETIFAKYEGKIMDQVDVIAWDVRHKYLDTVFKLTGDYAPIEVLHTAEMPPEMEDLRQKLGNLGPKAPENKVIHKETDLSTGCA